MKRFIITALILAIVTFWVSTNTVHAQTQNYEETDFVEHICGIALGILTVAHDMHMNGAESWLIVETMVHFNFGTPEHASELVKIIEAVSTIAPEKVGEIFELFYYSCLEGAPDTETF